MIIRNKLYYNMETLFNPRETYVSPQCISFKICTRSRFLDGSLSIPKIEEEEEDW